MQALVIGYGSIGARHARLLNELGHKAAVVSSHKPDFPLVYADLKTALTSHEPEYVVIANETRQHRETLSNLRELGFIGVALVEKPLFAQYADIAPQEALTTLVAYNLRFHPVIQRLRAVLAGEKVLTVQAYAGQYLPGWRPGTDYRQSYSASGARGGGVLRDLSHELDYLTWLLGGWQKVSALGGHLSSLEITSDDVFALLLTTPACPVVNLQVNYLDRTGRRSIIVNTDRHTIEANMIAGTLQVDDVRETFTIAREDTYRAMHQEILAGDRSTACTLAQGLDTMRLIDAAEHSVRRGEWVCR